MLLSEKESLLLEDLKTQEELCIKKYNEGAGRACDEQLSQLFSKISSEEQSHLDMINQMISGSLPPVPQQSEKAPTNFTASSCSPNAKEADKTLCQDALGYEKYVSSVYNTSVFEFKDQNARKILNHIQGEEQGHGKQLYDYMIVNQMY